MEFNCLKVTATSRRQFTFLPLSSQKFLVLILSTSSGWKAELTLEPPIGFEHGTLGLGIQHLNHLDIAPEWACSNVSIWVWANFRGRFLENLILRSFQPQFSLKFTRKCASISQNYFLNFWNQEKHFIWNIEKVLKLWSPWRFFQNLGPCNSRMGLF